MDKVYKVELEISVYEINDLLDNSLNEEALSIIIEENFKDRNVINFELLRSIAFEYYVMDIYSLLNEIKANYKYLLEEDKERANKIICDYNFDKGTEIFENSDFMLKALLKAKVYTFAESLKDQNFLMRK